MTRANDVAAAYINDATPGLYALNRNFAAYDVEQQTGANAGFPLWDEQTVKRLMTEQPDLMPYYPPARAVLRGIDLAWGKRQITAQVTSGILLGESLAQLADRLQTNIPDMNRASALRAARTAVTRAQNAGRLDSYCQAEAMGIRLKKRWLSTMDGRTRHAHQLLDGQTQDCDKPFDSELGPILFPGDPSADPANVYNCRCTMDAEVEGSGRNDALRRDRYGLLPNMTYAEWEASKRDAEAEPISPFPIAEIRGILSERDVYALNQYKSSNIAYPLNSILRGEAPMTEKYQQIVQDIDRALLKLPVYQGTVYRSMSSARMTNAEDFWEKHQPGETVTYSAYTSTGTEIYDETMDIQMVIQSKSGYDMRKYNQLEQEVLFGRGSTFIVEKREGNTLWLTEI